MYDSESIDYNKFVIFLVSAMHEIGSLCREQRKREVLKIGRENQRIIRRIVDVEPTFSIPRLEREWSNTMQYLDQISHYPREWWKDEVCSVHICSIPNQIHKHEN